MLVTAEIAAQEKKGFCYANNLHLPFFQEWCVTSDLSSHSGELLYELSFLFLLQLSLLKLHILSFFA